VGNVDNVVKEQVIIAFLVFYKHLWHILKFRYILEHYQRINMNQQPLPINREALNLKKAALEARATNPQKLKPAELWAAVYESYCFAEAVNRANTTNHNGFRFRDSLTTAIQKNIAALSGMTDLASSNPDMVDFIIEVLTAYQNEDATLTGYFKKVYSNERDIAIANLIQTGRVPLEVVINEIDKTYPDPRPRDHLPVNVQMEQNRQDLAKRTLALELTSIFLECELKRDPVLAFLEANALPSEA